MSVKTYSRLTLDYDYCQKGNINKKITDYRRIVIAVRKLKVEGL